MRAIAKRARHVPGRMNKTEERYSWELEARKRAGEVLWWAFEPVKLRLAEKTFYSPDFLVVLADCTMEMHEVKGHWEDDARVKIKVAAQAYPMFGFVAVQPEAMKRGGGWRVERF